MTDVFIIMVGIDHRRSLEYLFNKVKINVKKQLKLDP